MWAERRSRPARCNSATAAPPVRSRAMSSIMRRWPSTAPTPISSTAPSQAAARCGRTARAPRRSRLPTPIPAARRFPPGCCSSVTAAPMVRSSATCLITRHSRSIARIALPSEASSPAPARSSNSVPAPRSSPTPTPMPAEPRLPAGRYGWKTMRRLAPARSSPPARCWIMPAAYRLRTRSRSTPITRSCRCWAATRRRQALSPS